MRIIKSRSTRKSRRQTQELGTQEPAQPITPDKPGEASGAFTKEIWKDANGITRASLIAALDGSTAWIVLWDEKCNQRSKIELRAGVGHIFYGLRDSDGFIRATIIQDETGPAYGLNLVRQPDGPPLARTIEPGKEDAPFVPLQPVPVQA